jgi:hypothetical protein
VPPPHCARRAAAAADPHVRLLLLLPLPPPAPAWSNAPAAHRGGFRKINIFFCLVPFLNNKFLVVVVLQGKKAKSRGGRWGVGEA